MNFREWATKYLIDRGMLPDAAPGIVEAWIESENDSTMQNRWGDAAEGYPERLLVLFGVSLNRCALSWIEANLPQAWFKPMFDNALLNRLEHDDSEVEK